MSEEQLTALLVKLKDDAGLQEKLKAAGDLDTAVSIAKEAGSVAVRKDDAPAAVQAAMTNVVGLG